MRKLSLVASVAMVLASQGCTLKIPTGLLNGGLLNAVNGGVPATTASAPPGQVVTAKSPPPGKDPKPLPPVADNCTRGVLGVLDKFDANHDKALEPEEFIPWYTAAAQAHACDPGMETNGVLIANNGGGIIANNGNVILPAGAGGLTRKVQSTTLITGHGVIISNNSGAIISGNALISTNGGGLISNNAGGLISSQNGGLIADNGGPMPMPPDVDPPMPACGPLPDPKTAFMKADLNQDGRLDLGELCRFPFFPVEMTPGEPMPFPHPTKPPMPIGNDCKGGFVRADLNHDGFITPDEFFKARGVPFDGPQLGVNQPLPAEFVNAIMISNKGDFARRDTNGDGRIDPGEWCNYQPVPIPLPVPSYRPKPPIPTPPPACDLATADVDGDGYVSWEEYYRANTPIFEGVDDVEAYGDAKGLAYAGFKALDLNGDGQLDAKEMCAPPPPPVDPVPLPRPSGIDDNSGKCGSLFDTWDADGDQQISFEEYADAKWNELRFIKAPTPDEEQATRARFQAEAKVYDTNGNGSLDFIEFLKVCPVYVPNSVAVTDPNTAVTTIK